MSAPAQLLAAQDLLLHLTVNGRMPASKAELERWLAPVFCSNPDEQERFPRLYREWLAPLDGPASSSDGTPDTAGKPGGESPPPPDWRRIRRRLAYLAAALLLAGGPVASWFGWDYYLKERTLQGSVAGDHGAIGGATIRFVSRDGEETKTCQQTGGNGASSCAYHRSDLPAMLDVAAKDYLSQSQTIESPPETRIDFLLQRVPPRQPPPPDGAAATPVATLVPPPAIQTPVPPPQPPAAPLLPATVRVALALLAIGALWWWLWSVYRRGNTRRAVLDRFPAGTAAERYRLHRRWAGGLPRLFAGRELRDALRELRRHRSVVSRQLDAAATVEATVSQRGRFTPVYGRRRAAPEYLVLVDRRSGRDQQARLLDELLARLRRDGVYLDCWDFNGDPRLCWKSTGEVRFVGPADLAGLYPEHALLVFSGVRTACSNRCPARSSTGSTPSRTGRGERSSLPNRPSRWPIASTRWSRPVSPSCQPRLPGCSPLRWRTNRRVPTTTPGPGPIRSAWRAPRRAGSTRHRRSPRMSKRFAPSCGAISARWATSGWLPARFTRRCAGK
ncbi:MAG: hypothetical protein IPJ27_14070 [Candidatus Accumulibacter sp.]|uniref:Uncharacterized protein n=1 Tax=Candidatus Accumulibacter proximus TaxID=2954385 RepID=A0A935Q1E2_9PROT|nr:hypothetical protein [Candidatus Accumulibacter proximus]